MSPEKRNGVKRIVAPDHVARRRAALLQRRAPVLDADAVAGARVNESGNVARGVDSISRAQARINDNSAVLVQLDTFEEVRDRPHTDTYDNHIRFQTLAVIERDCLNIAGALKATDARAEFELHAMALMYAPEQRTDFRAQRRLERLLRRRNDRNVETTLAQAVSGLHPDEARADNNHTTRPGRRFDDRISISKTPQHEHVLKTGSGNVETNRRAAGRNQCGVVFHRLAACESYSLVARVNVRDFFVEKELDVVLLEKLFRTKRHPLRLCMSVQVVFTQVRTIVRRAVFTCDHHDVAAKAFFAQRLRGSVTPGARTDDYELPRVDIRVALDHRRRASIAAVFRHADENSFAVDAYVIACERVKGRRFFHVSVDNVEDGVVPGTHHVRAAKHAFSKWTTVVCTGRADCMKPIADTRQQDARLVN